MLRVLASLAAVLLFTVPAQAQSETYAALPDLVPSVILPVSFPDCSTDQVRGRQDADMMHGTGGRFAGGVVAGVLLGLIGTGIAYAIAAGSTPQPAIIPSDVSDQACYRQGYVDRAKDKNTNSALLGGLLGTAILVVVVVSAAS